MITCVWYCTNLLYFQVSHMFRSLAQEAIDSVNRYQEENAMAIHPDAPVLPAKRAFHRVERAWERLIVPSLQERFNEPQVNSVLRYNQEDFMRLINEDPMFDPDGWLLHTMLPEGPRLLRFPCTSPQGNLAASPYLDAPRPIANSFSDHKGFDCDILQDLIICVDPGDIP